MIDEELSTESLDTEEETQDQAAAPSEAAADADSAVANSADAQDGEDSLSEEEKQLGYLRQADYTRKTQDLARQRQELEARERAIAERESSAKSADGASDAGATDGFTWEDIELIPSDDLDPEEHAGTIEFLTKQNAFNSAVNKLGKEASVMSSLIVELVRDNTYNALQAEFARSQAAMAERFEGYELKWDDFIAALQSSDKVDGSNPFAYRDFTSWNNDTRRDIILSKVGPDLVKRLEDKVREKSRKETPKPPASGAADTGPSATAADEGFDPRDTASVRAYIEKNFKV
jgi:hypothetical protein